ncbi:MAG: hypothetical protein GEU74_00700 [Nitriliruptorales bacterium]|nr:hypothetical protein [Nitriliruptorales bacterium]
MTAVRSVVRRHLAIVLVLTLSVPMFSQPAAAADSRRAGEIRSHMEYLINRARARRGLRRLRVNSKTQYWARDHALRMKRRRAVFHDPNLRNEIPRGCQAWAENVARTTASNAARSAMTMFMNSSSHRSNILSRRMTHMGIGVAKGGNYTYIVQRFIDR